ncbi:MAG TPA: ATP-binding protein [Blastocatellia bacterium]|jgi:signal transduction histidine kinase/CheY-like chemotaxis protein|nr:ATP-binding protein [Blastocatellia bacterium]
MSESTDDLKRLLEQRSRELQSSEARFRNVINRNADGIIIVDSTGVVRFVNRAAESLFGRGAGELVGVALGFPIVDGETTEIDIIRRGGGTVTAEMRVVETEWEGEAAHLASLRDITDRKRAEQQRAQLIREQSARAEAEAAGRRLLFLAEASAALADALNYENTLAGVARLTVPYLADYAVVDLLEEDLSVRQVAVAHSDPAKEESLRAMGCYPSGADLPNGVPRVLRTGRAEIVPEVTEEWLRAASRDDEQLKVMRDLGPKSCMIVPLLARGRTLGAISLVSVSPARRYDQEDLALAEDIANRAALAADNARLYNEAQKANRLKDEFLATLSHELRTPLTALLGWTQMLRHRSLDRQSLDYALDAIERNAKAQTQIIEDVLDVSNIIRGGLRLNIQRVALPEIIGAAVASIRPAAEAKAIELEVRMDDSIGELTGDRDRLQQVVWNLLCNATKFTPKGGHIKVQVRQVEDGGQSSSRAATDVEIAVSDTGQGIKRDFLPFVFERFRQADGSSTREHGGLGLGLAIVRHLVEMHGGTVQVDSPGEGQGATFTVNLPLTGSEESNGAGPASRYGPLAREAGGVQPFAEGEEPCDNIKLLEGLRLLVVDDEPDTREMLDAALKQCGADVKASASAGEAIEELQRWRPHVIVADIGMPDEDGYDMIQRIRRLGPEQGGQTPAIALTAYARNEDRVRALMAGYQEHIPKPVEPDELVEIITKVAGLSGAG